MHKSSMLTTIKGHPYPIKKNVRPAFLHIFLLVTLLLLVFLPTLKNSFVYLDDGGYLWDNVFVKTGLSLENLKWAFQSTTMANWHPVTWLAHQLDCHVYGLMPGAHHAVNLILHIVNSILVYRLAHKLTGKNLAALLTTLLFSIHPQKVEVVAWASEKKELLCFMFLMLSIMTFLKYQENKKKRDYVASIFLFALSLMSKPMSVTLPGMLFLFDLLKSFSQNKNQFAVKTFLDNLWRAFSLERTPYWALSLASSWITMNVQSASGAVNSLGKVHLFARLCNAAKSYLVYLLDTLFPVNLACHYHFSFQGLLLKGIVSLLIIVVITFLSFKFITKYTLYSFSWLWYLLTLLPVIGIVSIGTMSHADRYMYLPSIGISLIGALILSDIQKRNGTFFLSILLILVACFGYTSHQLTKTWQNSESLVSRALDVNPENPDMLAVMGTLLLKSGDAKEALTCFTKLHSLEPQPRSFYLLGLAYKAMGKIEEARALFIQGINRYDDHFYRARCLIEAGHCSEQLSEMEEALSYYTVCYQDYPDIKIGQLKTAKVLIAQGKHSKALKVLNIAMRFELNAEVIRQNYDTEQVEKEILALHSFLDKQITQSKQMEQ